MNNLRKIMTFAHAIYRHGNYDSWSEALKDSWSYFRNNDAELIEMTSTKGVTSTRLVKFNWLDFYTPVGGGHPLKEGQTLMVDMAKHHVGKDRFLISTYNYKKVG